jgi:predicted AAA+ superfamily ATPase
MDDRRHDPRKLSALLRSLARTTASEASNATLARDAGGSEGPLHPDTVARYIDALERIFIVEVQEAWDVPLRSRTPLRKAPKRHLVDSSLTAAAMRVGDPARLLGDPETLGLLFESFVVQQLRTFADVSDAGTFHFRSKSGLEVDVIVERADGSWGAFEVKLGAGLIDKAASTLTSFAASLDTSRRKGPSILGVIIPTGPSYVRPDGVAVIALSNLGA